MVFSRLITAMFYGEFCVLNFWPWVPAHSRAANHPQPIVDTDSHNACPAAAIMIAVTAPTPNTIHVTGALNRGVMRYAEATTAMADIPLNPTIRPLTVRLYHCALHVPETRSSGPQKCTSDDANRMPASTTMCQTTIKTGNRSTHRAVSTVSNCSTRDFELIGLFEIGCHNPISIASPRCPTARHADPSDGLAGIMSDRIPAAIDHQTEFRTGRQV